MSRWYSELWQLMQFIYELEFVAHEQNVEVPPLGGLCKLLQIDRALLPQPRPSP